MVRTFLLLGTALAAAAPAAAQTSSAAISGLGIRNIGSSQMSGRIAALAARQEKDGKTTVYVGAASGGVWKSEDNGTNFKPVFDKQPVQSIGAVALDPNNKDVVWVGTGEAWTRNSVSIGNGVYKSSDGGGTWTNMGLPGTERITSIVVHPKNGNIVYVCAPGPLWSDSAERGLYKTTDGGRTWALVLPGANLSTGCGSVTLDPANPEHLLAGTWDFRRKGWEFRSGGDGPEAPSGSRFAESRDGGRTWTTLTADNRKGLPKGPLGRIEVAFAPSNPKQIYAFIENVRPALFVSEDGGKTWEERDRSQGMVWRPFYFAKIVVDPKDDKRLFKMGYAMIVSEDGGKSFSNTTGATHGDWHDIWINPANPKHIIGGDDGGMWISYDGGNRWWKSGNLPISQFYHVSADDKDPYQVYGGLQDNSSWVGDQEYPGGITNNRWENLYGGDGFWAFADPADPDYAYVEFQGGHIARVNRKTLEGRAIQPKAGYKEKLRWNWSAPIHLSPNDKGTIYIGSQFLFRSRDQGVNWERISPDLSTNDPVRQQQEKSGGITVDNSAAEMNTTIYSISESPRARGQIWVGTDDGNVQLTRDGGKNWSNVTANLGLAPGNWISWVEASRHHPAIAYVAVDRHTYGDMAPYIYRTGDYGKSWQRLVGPGTPGVRGYAHVVKEDRTNSNILFVGTELGLYASLDTGASWGQFKPNNFPDVAVRDIWLQEREDDLILATHGRGIWVIDDIAPLRSLDAATLARNAVLIPGRAVQQRIAGNGGWPEGNASYYGENPPSGAVISYYQKARHVIGRMKLEVLDAAGNVVDELPASKRTGLNRVVWSMRTKPPEVPPAASLAFYSTQGQRVLPGKYTLRLTKAGEVTTAPLEVTLDRRAKFSVADRRAQFAAAEQVKGLFTRMTTLLASINSVRTGADAYGAKADAAPAIRSAATALSAQADSLRKELVATKEGGAITGEERLREHVDDVYGSITSVEAAPTAYQLARIATLDRELSEVEQRFAGLKAGEVARFNALLQQANLPPLTIAAAVPADGVRGGRLSALVRGIVGTRLYRNAEE
ncbi:VPS10 domain-containing protein [Sphingomonas sp.]|uniref:WD40/YVTN/BNR-like repeat-containing protein n=1 Tax=Sphingomonas sp. TaxID=28214 RepID=UPI00286E0D88|nr:sialidase [Sphingomonas sp.]